MKIASARWRVVKEQWQTSTFYQRFESLVALILTLVITLIVLA